MHEHKEWSVALVSNIGHQPQDLLVSVSDPQILRSSVGELTHECRSINPHEHGGYPCPVKMQELEHNLLRDVNLKGRTAHGKVFPRA